MNFIEKIRDDRRITAIYLAVSTFVVLYLPYFVPQRPTASDSYLFGYNNRAGLILLVVLSLGGAIWMKGFPALTSSEGRAQEDKPLSSRVLWPCILLTALSCMGMYLFAGRFGGTVESSYEIDRIWLLSQGKAPYSGFEWPFGALPLYAPLWTSRLLHWSVPQGYFLWWGIFSTIGVWLLFATVRLLDFPSTHKPTIFRLTYVATLFTVIGMGTHYTLVRYALPLYFILTVYRVAAAGKTIHERWTAVVLAVIFTGCLLLISPEMAIAHAFAALVLLFPLRTPLSPVPVSGFAYAVLLAGLGLSFAIAWKLHVLDTMVASGGGADSFPLPFSLPVLFFLAIVLVCAMALVQRWNYAALRDNSVAIVLVSIPLLAAALGRCDPGHLILNGLGLLLASLTYMSSLPRRWPLFRSGFILCMIIVPALTSFWFFSTSVGMIAMRTIAEDSLPGHHLGVLSRTGIFVLKHMPESGLKRKELGRLQEIQRLIPPETIDFSTVYPGIDLSRADATFATPLGYKPNSMQSYLSSRVDYGFYENVENANTPAAVQRKIGELAAYPHRNLLLREEWRDACAMDPAAERHLITLLFGFPYKARARHVQAVHQPLCTYISEHYVLAQPATLANYRYELWLPAALP